MNFDTKKTNTNITGIPYHDYDQVWTEDEPRPPHEVAPHPIELPKLYGTGRENFSLHQRQSETVADKYIV